MIKNYQYCHKFLFNLFKVIISSFCFDKLVKISENASALQNFLFDNQCLIK